MLVETDGSGRILHIHVDGELVKGKANFKVCVIWEYAKLVRVMFLCLYP